MDKTELREQIKKIKSDSTLTESEKNLKIQDLMMGKAISNGILSNKSKSNKSKTCTHYDKRCYNFYFDCCGINDPCKRCHMERNSCAQADIKISEITCSECDGTQEPGLNCIRCQIQFSSSYCKLCQIWTSKEITHCDSCGICRVGLKENLYHCNTCGTCFNLINPETNESIEHICIGQTSLLGTISSEKQNQKIDWKEGVCVICMENTFDSQISSFPLKCNHFIHSECFNQMVQQGSYKCPCCKKSICDMSAQWNYQRQMIKSHPLPKDLIPINLNDIIDSPWGKFKVFGTKSIEQNLFYTGEFVDWVVSNSKKALGVLNADSVRKNVYKQIHCNDCGNKSNSPFHFYGLECNVCGSFNTQE